jgi:phosphopantothenoylcysteine synthetase/decarboxylase
MPIDRVRGITNIFTGRTGTQVALHASMRGHEVTLVTSHPELVADPQPSAKSANAPFRTIPYRTFDDLARVMTEEVGSGRHDALIHSAAVSDYATAGVYAPASGTAFDSSSTCWTANNDKAPRMRDCLAGKVKSDEPELWLRLVRAPKLVDRVRTDWRFTGTLVKFKLEVGVGELELQEIAERSRQQSGADWMVAKTLEGMQTWALIGNQTGYVKIPRAELADRVLRVIEKPGEGAAHG